MTSLPEKVNDIKPILFSRGTGAIRRRATKSAMGLYFARPTFWFPIC